MRHYLKIDCASLPPELVESELFGHEKGAFTGAVATKPGRLELAQGGTIVLDEVAALAPGVQAKLLRVLEERTLRTARRHGDAAHECPPDRADECRFARAPSRPGRFREDLFFRLNVLVIRNAAAARTPRGYPPRWPRIFSSALERSSRPHESILQRPAVQLLETYDWPGNVRELRNAIEHALDLRAER